MIVEPDFLEHWKTLALTQMLEDSSAPLCMIRLWTHCHNRRTDVICEGSKVSSARILAAIARWPICGEKGAESFFQALVDCQFVDIIEMDESGEKIRVIAHDWANSNSTLVANWKNGKKGGRPKKTPTQQKPKNTLGKPIQNPNPKWVNRPETHLQNGQTDRVDREEKIDRVEGEEEEKEGYPHLLCVLENDLTIENAIACLRAGHPAFAKVPDMNLQNSFGGQPDRKKWVGAISGLVARYAGAELSVPNNTLINWLAGKPSEKNAPADPVGKRLKLDF